MQNKTARWLEERFEKKLGRRWFLGGAAVAVSLPFLDVYMDVPRARAAVGAKRLFLYHIPAGVNVTEWKPTGTGTGFSFGSIHKPMEDAGLKDLSTVVTGTTAPGGPRGHTCGISGVLTGVQCKTDSANNAISFDQVAAQAWEADTRFPSVLLGTTRNQEQTNAETGYSLVIKDNLSWASATQPVEREVDPLRAFNRLFEGFTEPMPGTGTTDPPLTVKDATRKSVLDYVATETETLVARVGTADKVKLDQYLTGLRDLERSIQAMPTMGNTGTCTVGAAPASGRPSDIQAHVKVMLDILATAFKCDLTRVGFFAYENTVTEITHPFLDVNRGWHTSVTHHAHDASALADYAKVNQWNVSQFAYLAEQLKAAADGDSTLLDNSVGMMFSELADGNDHTNTDMPILLVGSAGGALKTGQAVAARGEIGAVHLTLLQALGVNATSFAGKNATLDDLLV